MLLLLLPLQPQQTVHAGPCHLQNIRSRCCRVVPHTRLPYWLAAAAGLCVIATGPVGLRSPQAAGTILVRKSVTIMAPGGRNNNSGSKQAAAALS